MTKETVNLLWTGGWDSTYRLVELSRTNKRVQPIYVHGEGRISENYEIRAMNRVLEGLAKKKETTAEILPIKYVLFNSIELREDISKAYHSIADTIHFGTQYEWLPCLAFEYPNLEIGIEKAPPEQSGAINAVKTFGKMVFDETSGTYILDKENSSEELVLVYGNLRFPIIEKDATEMKANIVEWGYEDIMENVWMCFRPIFGKPCGLCNPCKSKMESNMAFLLPPVSKKRYYNRNNEKKVSFYRYLQILSYKIDKLKFR